MWPLETTLEKTLNMESQSLNVYNGLAVLHFIALKHASSCVRKLREDTFKKHYSIQRVMFLAQE